VISSGSTLNFYSSTTFSGTIIDNGAITVNSSTVTGAASTSGAATITGSGTLTVASAASIALGTGGTISLTGGIANAGIISIASGAALIGAVTDNGTIAIASGGFLSATGSLAGAGSLKIASGGSATLGGLGSGSTLAITDDGSLTIGGTLGITSTTSNFTSAIQPDTVDMTGTTHGVVSFSGTTTAEVTTLAAVTDFGVGDSIILGASLFTGFKTSDSINIAISNTNQLSIADYTQLGSGGVDSVIRLAITGSGGVAIPLTTGNPHLVVTSLAGGGYLVTDVPCFATGTRILTASGEVPVEDIAQGDVLVTALHGKRSTARVIWTGKRAIDIARHPAPDTVLPVRITAHAFGPGVPKRDLRLSPHHAVFIDGHFFMAVALVNGTTIYQETNTKSVVYHHIELETHSVILAEDLPSESYMDYDNRHMFEDPFAPIPLTLLPDFRPKGDEGMCAPLIRDGALLDAAREKLNARATALEPARSA
jgi:hypothetical protein